MSPKHTEDCIYTGQAKHCDGLCVTGRITLTTRGVADPGHLLLIGQELKRADYLILWQWAQVNDLVKVGTFGDGDGETTFTLPDTRGRTINADTGEELMVIFQIQYAATDYDRLRRRMQDGLGG